MNIPGPKFTSTLAYNWPAIVREMLDEGEIFRVRDVREASHIQTIQELAAECGAEYTTKGTTFILYPPNCVIEEQGSPQS
jgi:hypothetical protein